MNCRTFFAWPLVVVVALHGCLLTGLGQAQEITVLAKSSLEQQQESIQKQRESVERQLGSIRTRTAAGETKPKRVNSPINFTASALPPFEPLEMPVFPPAPSSAMFDCPALPGQTVDGLIQTAAKREDLSVDLLRAVIKRESAFHPCAVSNKGALGLMQLMPETAEQFGVEDPFNPVQNLRGGAAFLKQLINRFGGDVRLALGAYNAGPERVAAANRIPDLQETQDYVAAISAEANLPVAEEPNEAPKPKATNAMTKPDLRHLRLMPANRDYFHEPTPVHLTAEPQQ